MKDIREIVNNMVRANGKEEYTENLAWGVSMALDKVTIEGNYYKGIAIMCYLQDVRSPENRVRFDLLKTNIIDIKGMSNPTYIIYYITEISEALGIPQYLMGSELIMKCNGDKPELFRKRLVNYEEE